MSRRAAVDLLARRVRQALSRPGDPPVGHSLYSAANDRRFEYWVWQPPAPSPPGPVVLVLHGVNDASGFLWWQAGRAQQTAARLVATRDVPPFTLVIGTDGGFGYGSAYIDWADGSALVETHVMSEVLPWIRTSLGVSGPVHICGNSMGGYGAVTLAFRHPDAFQSVSAMSGYFRPRTRLGCDDADRRQAMYGSDDRLAAHDPHALAETVPGLRLAIDCGTDDWLLEESRSFHARLDDLGVAHDYRELPGGHDWDYWRGRFGAHLRFHLTGAPI